MIADSINSAEEIVDACRSRGHIDTLGQSLQNMFDTFAISATSEKFPGAVLALPSKDSPTVYFAIAPKSEDWRRLRPLLISYVGPTFSTFDGKINHLDSSSENPFEKFLASKEATWFRATKIVPGNGDLEDLCSEGLSLMIKNYLNAPHTIKASPKTTEQLIADFVDALSVRNRKRAENIIQECKDLCRLDTPNLNFMRVKMLSHFNEWKNIINFNEDNSSDELEHSTSQSFKTLCNGKKTQSITSILLEAIYQTYFSHIEDKNEISVEDVRSWKNLRPIEESKMLEPRIPKCIRRGGLTLYTLELHELRSKVENFEKDGNFTKAKNLKLDFNELLQATKYVSRDFDNFSLLLTVFESFEEKLINSENTDDINDKKYQEALELIRRHGKKIDLSSNAEAKKLAEGINNELRDKLIKSKITSDSFQSMEEESEAPVPESWPEFFRSLGDTAFINYFQTLELAIDEWPVTELNDPAKIKELNESLDNIIGEEQLFYDRISICIPLITTWLENAPDSPRVSLTELYENILNHIVLGVKKGKQVYESTEKIVSALLSFGCSKEKYKDLLDNCFDISKGIGSEQISWALDVLDATYHWPCPDDDERDLFFTNIFSVLEKKKQFLSEGQILLIKDFHQTPGWINELESVQEDQKNKLRYIISDKVRAIAIYSLTESVLKRVEAILKKVIPDIKVHLSHDKGGSKQLENFAKTADIFVIATSSAKHAATEFIRNNRPDDKTTLYADGKGSSSIIRALEEHYH